MKRFAASPVHSSLLGVGSAASIEAVGFDAVGEVMGCAVMQMPYVSNWGCGYVGGMPGGLAGGGFSGGLGGRGFAGGGYPGGGIAGGTTGGGYVPAPIQGSGSRFAGFSGYVAAVVSGYRTALARLHAEASSMGADGVIGIRWTASPLGSGFHEYMAMGTAIRSRGRARPARAFTTDMDGAAFASLLAGGWAPVSLETALEIAIRHDDWSTRMQSRSWQNTELPAVSELAQFARHAVREKLTGLVRAANAEGAVVSGMEFRLWEQGEHPDHVAEARITATTIVPFARDLRRQPPRPLSILPLRPL
jgi:uncharacterized protein YbjQ (UPF0145 family)